MSDQQCVQDPIQHWRTLRVGAFIHWTPLVLADRVESRGEYANLFKRFIAEKFDASEWVSLLKDAGMKYVLFTTKHGDSCCMWDTDETEYNIMKSPMGRDVVGELTEECKRQELSFAAYYALHNDSGKHPDWTSAVNPDTREPDYSTRTVEGDPVGYHLPEGLKPDFERYFEHVKAQLKELSDNYGPFLFWWFDQLAATLTHEHGVELYSYLKELQPNVLTNNRVDTPFDRGLNNATWFVTEGKSVGDFASSEISIARFNRDVPWEHLQYAGAQTSWFWKPNDVYRPLTEWISEIVKTVCRDGNYMLGIGPMPDGRFQPKHVDQLMQLGAWLKRYGESIYGTRGGPFKANSWYGSTCKGNTVYVHIFRTDKGMLTLPPLNTKIADCYLMNNGAMEIEQTEKGITVTIGENDLQNPVTIAVLQLEESAVAIEPVEERVLTLGAKVHASNVRENEKCYSPEMSCDGDSSTYWTTDEGVQEAWIEYDLGRPFTFARAILDEGDDKWIREVQILVKAGAEWNIAFEYRHGVPELWKDMPVDLFCPEFVFEPATSQFVKVKVKATKSPVIREFSLYER